MLFSIINSVRDGDFKIIDVVVMLLSTAFVVFCTLPIHEYAHAKVATLLGDDTARLQGRLTLNPMAHIDKIGALLIFLVGFGYAKPVPVNMRKFKNPKGGMALTALAGPVSNLIMAFIFCFFLSLTARFAGNSIFGQVICVFLNYAAYINIGLAVFNFIPIPPLDGSRIATLLIPNKYYYKIMQYERYIMIGMMVLLFSRILTAPLSYLTNLLMSGFLFVTNSIF